MNNKLYKKYREIVDKTIKYTLILYIGTKILDHIEFNILIQKYAKILKVKYEELYLSNKWNK